MEASVFIATSLDGFIAREDGDLSWLGAPESEVASAPGGTGDASREPGASRAR